jgi:hypothetical protein
MMLKRGSCHVEQGTEVFLSCRCWRDAHKQDVFTGFYALTLMSCIGGWYDEGRVSLAPKQMLYLPPVLMCGIHPDSAISINKRVQSSTTNHFLSQKVTELSSNHVHSVSHFEPRSSL